ncbi:uncharacterized protein J4E78_005106 [Alternaria triticimaculans]|uniref:uncharacterized protein n=1 Tax=Alternaria triticimaculans TaxID=297637 RepID=UPI0020C2627F|nr:uncharacterized protein J4E78_005106 [Alternaria triticimaculans]KAI4660403.1 hypothetical protein J4E78_005106 [Alternaria triticimaculans]
MSASAMSVRCLASTRIPICDAQDGQKEARDEDRDRAQSNELGEAERVITSSGEAQHQSMEDEPEDKNNNHPSDRQSSPRSSLLSSELESESEDGSESNRSDHEFDTKPYTSCIQEAQLSPDGTCVFTSDYSRQFSVYPISNDILTQTNAQPLTPYASLRSADPIWAFAVNPLFNLQDASSTTVLISRRDAYISLHNALWSTLQKHIEDNQISGPVDISTPLASYKLINNLTEAVIAPLSLAYSTTATHFFAGSKDEIAIFDLLETDKPIHTIRTIPAKRNKLKGGGRGFKGQISALSLSPPSHTSHDGILAAGSRTRYIGIYDPVGGTEVTHFSLPGTINGIKFRNENLQSVMGDGVTSLKWSPCGKYLYVAERSSDVLLIYDVRNFSLTLGYCAGRQALTRQKLGFDVWNAGQSPYDVEGISHEVWAGGMDGKMRVWRDPYRREGAVQADEVVEVGDGKAPVVGSLVHASGSLAVAACGRVGLGGDMEEGTRRGGGVRPVVREWGSLDILGLG